MENKRPVLRIVIPCYNEEKVLPETAPMFLKKLDQLTAAGRIAPESRVLFVNDGSKDRTWEIIRALHEKDARAIGLSLSRNRGHQNALIAGLMESRGKCDMTISIDCDGQDDIDAMDDMTDAYLDGCEVVYGVRSRRDTDSFFKRATAEGFYKILALTGAEVVFNHADYRLLGARALEALSSYEEVNLFLRGLVPLIGFKSTTVAYERRERIAGESHYPLKKMLALAGDGITSLSIKPIRLLLTAGVMLGFGGALWLILAACLGAGLSLPALMILLTGLQLTGLGIVGEYVGKTYMESKHRPRYIIGDRTEA